MPRFLTLLFALSASAGAAAQSIGVEGRRCATPDPPLAEVIETVQLVRAHERLRGVALRAAGETTVPVVFHVISAGPGDRNGEVPLSRIVAQIDTLNGAFADAGYRFVLAAVERVENAEWYTDLTINSDEEEAMKAALALDPARYLNVYTASLGNDFLGWADTPDATSEVDLQSGVVLLDQSVPGGTAAPFDRGHTGTHEVGHWMGLLHTFQGGCSAPNDGVADTPQERSGATGCPTGRDSCPGDPGLDPITNYMDYSDDVCMTGFTAGQNTRVQALTDQYRPTLAAGGIVFADVARTAFQTSAVNATTTDSVFVTNLRADAVTVTSASSTNGAFAVRGLPVTVAPGDAVRLAVDLTPPDAGAQSTVLSLETDIGETLQVSVVAAAGQLPALRVATPTVDAETVEEGGATGTLRLANDGGGALAFAVETVNLPSWVAGVAPRSGTVAPGETTEVTLGLTAASLAAGTYDAVLVVTTNDPRDSQVEVPLRLVVRARPVATAGTLPMVTLIENDAASATLVLANTGAGALDFAIDPEALPAGVATVVPLSGTVPPGGEASLTVSFSSAELAVDEYQAFLPITTNDPFAPFLEVPVSVTVQARPARLAVRSIFPNPGRGRVTIPLDVPAEAPATVQVFDARGRLMATVFDGTLADGYPTLEWDASRAPAGVYLVRVQTDRAAAVGRVVITR